MNMLLAIEQSTDIGGVAFIRGRNVLAQRQWKEERSGTRLFEVIAGMLDESGLNMDAFDSCAVGLGPGSYTGLRISLAAALAFALPDRRPVYGLNSAEPLAHTSMEEYSCGEVFVVGDARRGRLWARSFTQEPGEGTGHSCARTWRLVGAEELRALCPPGGVCVSPDWDRIGPILESAVSGIARVIRKKRVPSAAALGMLAAVRMKRGVPSEPLTPIYLNTAVRAGARSGAQRA